MEFYVYLNGARRGPFTEECVRSFLADGLLLPTDLAADEATADWKPLAAFRKFATEPVPPAPPVIEPGVVAAQPPSVRNWWSAVALIVAPLRSRNR